MIENECWALEGDLLSVGITEVNFDSQRHLIVQPYSLENLHQAASILGIKRCWFHRDHYDIPKRLISWFEDAVSEKNDGFFRKVSPREIWKIIHKEAIR